jgi:hypothetical protein
MVQAGERKGSTQGRKLESIVDWGVVDRSHVDNFPEENQSKCPQL